MRKAESETLCSIYDDIINYSFVDGRKKGRISSCINAERSLSLLLCAKLKHKMMVNLKCCAFCGCKAHSLIAAVV
jgi:hypothetical protein